MNFLVQNMEFSIPRNGGDNILNYIMCDNALFPMNIMK
jgi:hypothetical protein